MVQHPLSLSHHKQQQQQLEEETEAGRLREEKLKREVQEEKDSAEERLRKREARLREMMREDQERNEGRLADLRRTLEDERERSLQLQRDGEELREQLNGIRFGLDGEKKRLEDEMDVRLRAREDALRLREGEILGQHRAADKDRADTWAEEQRRRDAAAAEREAELADEVERLRGLLKKARAEADAAAAELHEELGRLRRTASDEEASLLGRLSAAEQELAHANVLLAREQDEHRDVKARLAEETEEWGRRRTELEAQLTEERKKLITEREQWERDLAAERETMGKLVDLELARQKQELEEAYEARLEALRQQLSEAKAQVLTQSPPRRPASASMMKRPQPQAGDDTPMRRPMPQAPQTPQSQALSASGGGGGGGGLGGAGDDPAKNKALLRELDAARHQIEALKQRGEELDAEMDMMRRREKERIASEVDDANKRIYELRSRKGSLEDARTDAERKLREAQHQASELQLQLKKNERTHASELQDLKDQHHEETKRAQARYRDLEAQLRQSEDRVRALEDQLRDAERYNDKREGATGYSEAQLQSQLAALTAEVTTLRQQMARRSEELASRSVELAAAQGELTAKTSEMLGLQSKLAASEEKVEAMVRALQERDALVKAQAELAASEADRQAEMIQVFEDECNHNQHALEQLQALLQKRQEELDIAMIEAGGVRRDVEALRAENARLREELLTTRDHLRRELEQLRDEAQGLERRAFAAERDAAVQREHAEGLQNVLSERGALESEGRKAATDAMAEAAERELARLREQLATKTDQLLTKDRKEEALLANLSALLAEVIPGEEHDDATQVAVEKLRGWKAYGQKGQRDLAALQDALRAKAHQLNAALKRLSDLSSLRRKLVLTKRQLWRLRRRLAKVHSKRHGRRGRSSSPGGGGGVAALVSAVSPSEARPAHHSNQPYQLPQQHQQNQQQQQQVPHQHQPQQPHTPQHVVPRSSSSVPEGSPNRAPRVPLPTKSMLSSGGPRDGSRRTELSPPPPPHYHSHQFHRDVVSPEPARTTSPRRLRRAQPSMEQLEDMLSSMELLINEPLPGTESKAMSPKRVDAFGKPPLAVAELPPPPPPPYAAALSPGGVGVGVGLGVGVGDPSARVLLDAHQHSRMRREQRAEELQALLETLRAEAGALKAKESELVSYREKTCVTIDEQQASLLNDVNYWRQQLRQYEQRRLVGEAARCREQIAQSEQDLSRLVRQKPEMLVKAEQGQSHLQAELIKTVEQTSVLEAEFQQLTAEIGDLRAKENALQAIAAASPPAVVVDSLLLPPASHLPPALPPPTY